MSDESAVKLTLDQKIRDIQASVGVVKKKGFNKEHQYKFLRIEDAVLAVNKMMSSRDLILTPNLLPRVVGESMGYWLDIVPHTGGKGYIATTILEWTLEDVVTKEKRMWVVAGTGYDTTDKALLKANTASRKQAIIAIFNIPVGDDSEAQSPAADRQDAKNAAQGVAAQKIAQAAGRGSKAAVDALAQVEPEKKLFIARPEEHNGNYVVVTGFIAAPQLERFFDDTGSKRFKTKTDLVPYWRVPSEYESGLVKLAQQIGLEVEG